MDIQFWVWHNRTSRKRVKTENHITKGTAERETERRGVKEIAIRRIKTVEIEDGTRVQVIGTGIRDADRRGSIIQEEAAVTAVKIKPITDDKGVRLTVLHKGLPPPEYVDLWQWARHDQGSPIRDVSAQSYWQF